MVVDRLLRVALEHFFGSRAVALGLGQYLCEVDNLLDIHVWVP